MTVMLITALRAAETLATFHRQRAGQALGATSSASSGNSPTAVSRLKIRKARYAAAMLRRCRPSSASTSCRSGMPPYRRREHFRCWPRRSPTRYMPREAGR